MNMEKKEDLKIPKHLVGNIGLYYVCYELSKRGWNCLPTSRNAKGVDIVIYSQNAKCKYAIQVKSLSKRNSVPFGSSEELIADFLIIYRDAKEEKPEIFIIAAEELGPEKLHNSERDGRISYWLELGSYEGYKDCWKKIHENPAPI
jgi:hypothetical protein